MNESGDRSCAYRGKPGKSNLSWAEVTLSIVTMESMGAHGGADVDDQADSVDDLADVVASVSVSDDDEHATGDITESTSIQRTECPDYKMGVCMRRRTSCPYQHPHVPFPSASKWETHHMNRFRFEAYQFETTNFFSEEEVICYWIVHNATIVGDIDCAQLPSCPATPATKTAIARSAIGKPRYCQVLQNHVTKLLQEDVFVKTIKKFAQQYDMITDPIQTLLMASATDDLDNAPESAKPHHRSLLMRWITSIKTYRKASLPEASLAQLISDLLVIIRQDTGCPFIIQVRESTARKLVLCGQTVNVESDIEVQTVDGEGLIQVITFSENEVHSRPTDITNVLPRLACEALAVGKDSPFGNQVYKTVYQVYIHSVYCSESGCVQLYAFLVKCHLSVDTLENMSHCPIESCRSPSFIMHKTYSCGDFRSCKFLSFVYKALKAAVLTYQGIEVDEKVDKQ
ncbi:uncharacterized protein [Ptychodera flava]|uniref:uncharacterized protein n=1 Tax=Ptychodera flava TaxID=63121 RepID=UPI00396AA922